MYHVVEDENDADKNAIFGQAKMAATCLLHAIWLGRKATCNLWGPGKAQILQPEKNKRFQTEKVIWKSQGRPAGPGEFGFLPLKWAAFHWTEIEESSGGKTHQSIEMMMPLHFGISWQVCISARVFPLCCSRRPWQAEFGSKKLNCNRFQITPNFRPVKC